jgi:hypothetical protein
MRWRRDEQVFYELNLLATVLVNDLRGVGGFGQFFGGD